MYVWMEGENKGWLWVSRNVQCESASLHQSTSICLLSLMSWWEVWYSKLMSESSHQLRLFFCAWEMIINQNTTVLILCHRFVRRGGWDWDTCSICLKKNSSSGEWKTVFYCPRLLRSKPSYLFWLNDPCLHAHEQRAAAAALHPRHQVGFSPPAEVECPAVCPFYQNSTVLPFSEETEMLCSKPCPVLCGFLLQSTCASPRWLTEPRTTQSQVRLSLPVASK